MTANNAHDGELERKLAAHFAAGNGNVPPTPDLWAALHDRLGEQKPRPLWARIRDWRTAMGRFRGTLTLATTAATVVVIAIAGAVWLAGGGFGPGGVVEVRYVEGPPGPAGPAGAQGARGAQGAAGAKGAAGAAGQTMVVEKEKPVVVEKVVTVEKLVEKPVVITKAVERVVEKPVVVQEKVVTVEKAVAAPTRVPASAPTQPAAVEKKVAPSRPAPTRPVGQPGTTTFQDTARQPLTATRDDAVSTFSLDTDRTSFQLALNWARAGHRVDPKSVRAEEWVNAFDYGYAAPRASDRFAITSALFAHPLDRGKYMARVAFQAPDVVTTAPLNVTLVLDASGSMREGNRVAIAPGGGGGDPAQSGPRRPDGGGAFHDERARPVHGRGRQAGRPGGGQLHRPTGATQQHERAGRLELGRALGRSATARAAAGAQLRHPDVGRRGECGRDRSVRDSGSDVGTERRQPAAADHGGGGDCELQ